MLFFVLWSTALPKMHIGLYAQNVIHPIASPKTFQSLLGPICPSAALTRSHHKSVCLQTLTALACSKFSAYGMVGRSLTIQDMIYNVFPESLALIGSPTRSVYHKDASFKRWFGDMNYEDRAEIDRIY